MFIYQVNEPYSFKIHFIILLKICKFQVEFNEKQKCFIINVIKHLKSLNYAINLCEDSHISLSKTFPIKRHSIEPLWSVISDEFKEFNKYLNF